MLFEDIIKTINYDNLSCYKSVSEYPDSCIPTSLRPPTGKARKADFEQINLHLYAKEAKMAAFRVERKMVNPYIQALHFIFYERIGNSAEFMVKWYDVPEEWKNDCVANAINIDVYRKENTDEMLFKITFFITTGTIQIQGNAKNCFTNEIFPCLKKLANVLQQSNSTLSETAPISENTEVKTVAQELNQTNYTNTETLSEMAPNSEITGVKTVANELNQTNTTNPNTETLSEMAPNSEITGVKTVANELNQTNTTNPNTETLTEKAPISGNTGVKTVANSKNSDRIHPEKLTN
jgi:hypothetical protein